MAIPANLRGAIFATELNAGQSSAPSQGFRVLLVGMGSEDVGITKVINHASALDVFGKGELAEMFRSFFKNTETSEVYGMQKKATGGTPTASQIDITVTALAGTATDSGTFYIYINGERVPVIVAKPDSSATAEENASAIATSIASAINVLSLPVTAGVKSGSANIVEVKNDVVGASSLTVAYNYEQTDASVVGVSIAVGSLAIGAGVIDYSTVVASLDPVKYDIIAIPDNAKSTIQPLLDEMEVRWGATKQNDGIIFASNVNSFSALSTYGESLNERFLSVVGLIETLTPSYAISASYAGAVAPSLLADPALPLISLVLESVKSPKKENEFEQVEVEGLLYSGITPLHVNPNDKVFLKNTISTFQKDSQGNESVEYLNLNPIFTMSRIRQDYNVALAGQYGRAKIVADGVILNPGQSVVSPNVMRAFVFGQFKSFESKGWLKNVDAIKNMIVVSVDSGNANRLNVGLSPSVVNQLEIVGTSIDYLVN